MKLVLCISLPFTLPGILGHLCHVCPVGSKQRFRLEDGIRLTVTLQYTAISSFYVTYADIKYGTGKQALTVHIGIALCVI
jgi:hypothetical protein